MFSKSEALSDLLPISDKGFDEEKDEKTVWAEGAGGGVEEALVPHCISRGDEFFWSCGELEDG